MVDWRQFKTKFKELYNGEPRFFSAPGRVNLIGEHTDYNEGFVLPFAIKHKTYVAISARADNLVKVFSKTINEGGEFSLEEDFTFVERNWTLYVRGIFRVLQQEGFDLRGANILIDSDIPFGAGLSSSAALEISVGSALSSVFDLGIKLTDLAFIGQRVEHEFVGVKSGIMDQFASALGRAGHAILIDCRSLEIEYVPLLLGDAALVVCNSNVKHELASSEYNTRRAECEQGVEILQSEMPQIKSLRDVRLEDFLKFEYKLPPAVRKRCRHVIKENARTLAAVAALKERDLTEFGNLMFASHASLRDDYEVSCAELDKLVEIAREHRGVFGARMTGGGFGGCTINLVRGETLEEFEEKIVREYKSAFGFEPTVYAVEAAEGARELKL